MDRPLANLERHTNLVLEKFRNRDQGNLVLYDLTAVYVALSIAERVVSTIQDEMRGRPRFPSRETTVNYILGVVSRVCSGGNDLYADYIFSRYPEEAKEMVKRRVAQAAVNYYADRITGAQRSLLSFLPSLRRQRTMQRTIRVQPQPPPAPRRYTYTPMWHVPTQYDRNEECDICREILGTDVFGHLSGNVLHVFHKNCIDEWYINAGNCPKCRARFGKRKRSNRRQS